MADLVGLVNTTSKGSPQFTTDRFGNANDAILVNSMASSWNWTSDVFLFGDYTITAWVRNLGCSSANYIGLSHKFKVSLFWCYIFNKHFLNCQVVLEGASPIQVASSAGSCKNYMQNQSTNFADSSSLLSTWYHLANVLSGTTGRIYVNGTQTAQMTTMTPPSNVVKTICSIDWDETNVVIDGGWAALSDAQTSGPIVERDNFCA